MYPLTKKTALRGFIAVCALTVPIYILILAGVIPNKLILPLTEIHWTDLKSMDLENPATFFSLLMWALIFFFGSYLLLKGFKLSRLVGEPVAASMVQTMGFRNGMLLFYIAIWFAIGWGTWNLAMNYTGFISSLIYQFVHYFNEGTLAYQVFHLLFAYIAFFDVILQGFLFLFPIIGVWRTLVYMEAYRRASGGQFHDILDDPNLEI